MNKQVAWLLELSVKDGELANVKALMQEMIEATKASEPDALNYEWSFSADESQCHIYERYADSVAVMTHLGNFQGMFAERFLTFLEPTRLQVYGVPSDDAVGALSGLGAVFMTFAAGFAR